MESKKTAKQLKIFEPRTTNKKQTRTILVKLVNVLIRHARNIQVAKKNNAKNVDQFTSFSFIPTGRRLKINNSMRKFFCIHFSFHRRLNEIKWTECCVVTVQYVSMKVQWNSWLAHEMASLLFFLRHEILHW